MESPARARADLLERLLALDALIPALAEVLDVRQAFQQISTLARDVLPHDLLLLTLLTDDRAHVRVHAVTGGDGGFSTSTVPLTDDQRLLAESTSWESHVVADMQDDVRERALPPGQRGYRARLVVPIRLRGRHAGALDFFSLRPDAYGDGDAVVARRIADHVTLALSHERLAEEAERAAQARRQAARLERRVRALAVEVDALGGRAHVVGTSPAWARTLAQATQVAATDTTVLLLGESGTGKEVLARFIHRASARAQGPFVAVNCAALPEQLVESELFGHERGAFTGALAAKPGQLELAESGVLFLDEVSEMSPAVQAKFLRVLEARELRRVGGTRTVPTDVRIVAATHRDLSAAIARGDFRADLYYRLAVFEIALPSLRERPEDVLPLAAAFLEEIARSLGRPPARLAPEAERVLVAYAWPGNVRQLRNALERASIVCEGGLVRPEDLALPAAGAAPTRAAVDPLVAPTTPVVAATTTDLASLERAAIERALTEARFNKSKAARALGLSRTQLYVRLRKHGLVS